MTEAVCAIDLGTTGCRALLMGEEGGALAEHYVEYPSQYGPDGAVEQDANLWWQVCVECVRRVAGEAPGASIGAVGLSAQGHSWVLLDERLRPLRPALCWLDTRATPFAERVLHEFGAERMGALTGKLPGAWHLLPQLLMLREQCPDLVAGARWYALCLDFIAAAMTGRCVTEPTTAAGSLLLDLSERRWAEELLGTFAVPAEKLPPVVPSGSVVGELTAEAAQGLGLPEGIPVVIGGQDQKCAALGAGLGPQAATASLGTSTAVTVLTGIPGFDSRTRIPCFPYLLPDTWEWEAPLATTGGALRWLREVMTPGAPYEEMARLASTSPIGAKGVTFQPHLAGAASPHWAPERRAAFAGLSLSTSPGDLIRAVMEGVACEIRLNVEALESLAGGIDSVRLFGGGARSQLWTELIAGVLQRPVQIVQRVETAAVGAAMLAAGRGSPESVARAQKALLPPTRAVIPIPADAPAYRALYLRYLAL